MDCGHRKVILEFWILNWFWNFGVLREAYIWIKLWGIEWKRYRKVFCIFQSNFKSDSRVIWKLKLCTDKLLRELTVAEMHEQKHIGNALHYLMMFCLAHWLHPLNELLKALSNQVNHLSFREKCIQKSYCVFGVTHIKCHVSTFLFVIIIV